MDFGIQLFQIFRPSQDVANPHLVPSDFDAINSIKRLVAATARPSSQNVPQPKEKNYVSVRKKKREKREMFRNLHGLKRTFAQDFVVLLPNSKERKDQTNKTIVFCLYDLVSQFSLTDEI